LHCYIIYAHPSKNSFTHSVLQSFIAGLTESNHTCEIGDLYQMNFNPVMDISQYEREVRITQTQVPQDVKTEHEKIQKAEALIFVYPNWWSDCPAILKGWFDKIWSYGFAYEYVDNVRHSYVKPRNALIICTAGYTAEKLEEIGIAESMRMVMINDRLKNQNFDKVKMVFLGGMPAGQTAFREANLEKAYLLGKDLLENLG
jgi:NAD(P)H dehydrogenase (quinone)